MGFCFMVSSFDLLSTFSAEMIVMFGDCFYYSKRVSFTTWSSSHTGGGIGPQRQTYALPDRCQSAASSWSTIF